MRGPTTSATSVAISAACSTTPTTSAAWASARCGSRRSSTTRMKPSPAESPQLEAAPSTDRGKTGYHGYWGVKFYRLDEHLPSKGLDLHGPCLCRARRRTCKVVLDIVGNHGSPAPSMPKRAAVCSARCSIERRHAARRPPEPAAGASSIRSTSRCTRFYNTSGWRRARRALAELGDFNENNPGGDGLPRRRVPAVDRAGRRRVPHRHHRLVAASVFWHEFVDAHARANSRACSCSAKRSTTTRGRSPNTPGAAERERQRARFLR